MLGLLLEVALGDEQREIGIPVARRLEAAVQVALDALPDLEPVRPDREGPTHGPVICELGHPHELQIPPARVLTLLDQLLDRFGHPHAPLLMKFGSAREYIPSISLLALRPVFAAGS